MPRKSILNEAEETTEINLSPMIDCIFILLIFFIVTTEFVEEVGVPIHKPDPSEAPPVIDEALQTIVLKITANDKIFEDGLEIGIQSVASHVRRKLTSEDVPVSIRAHEKASHGIFLQVWDAARTAGAQKISFMTQN